MDEPKSSARCKLDYLSNILVSQNISTNAARHTKICATVSPNCNDIETLEQMITAGVDIIRINLSYVTVEELKDYVKNIRIAQDNCSKRCGFLQPTAIAVQTKGPEIRTGYFEGGKSIFLKKGETFKLCTDKAFYTKGNHNIVYIDYENIQKSVNVGNKIQIDYDNIELICTGIQGSYVITVVDIPGELHNYKPVKIPGVIPEIPRVTEKDRQDLMVCSELEIDMIILSSVSDTSVFSEVGEILGPYREKVLILAKLERFYNLEHLAEIVSASDGFVLTYYELTIEEPITSTGPCIKKVINLCNKFNKPIMIGPELVDSLSKKTYPTTIEASGVTSAIYDGIDCICTNVTSLSEQPVEVIRIIDTMVRTIERSIPDTEPFAKNFLATSRNISIIETIAETAVQTSIKLHAAAIVVVSQIGDESKYLSKLKPRCPILVSTHTRELAQRLNLIGGVIPIQLKVPDIDLSNTKLYIDVVSNLLIKYGKAHGFISLGDPVVFTHMSLENGDYSAVMGVQYTCDLAIPLIINDWEI